MKLFYPPKHQPTPSLTAANKNNICNQQVPCLQQVGVGSAYLSIQQVGVGSTRLAYPRFQATLSSKILLAFLHFLGPHLHRNRTPLIFSSKNGSTPLPLAGEILQQNNEDHFHFCSKAHPQTPNFNVGVVFIFFVLVFGGVLFNIEIGGVGVFLASADL